MDDRQRYRVIKRFEKPRPAAPLAVSASDGVQRGLRAEDADDTTDGGPGESDFVREPTGGRRKRSAGNSSRAAVLQITMKQV